MSFISKNPFTEETFATFEELSPITLEQKIAVASDTFAHWKDTSFAHRAERMKRLASLLRERKNELGLLATLEMGKPITQALAEIEKCAWVCDYYADEAEKILREESLASDATESFVRFDPLGVILAVMPWNFPYWQVFRFAAPAVMAGNVGLLKHASNVPQCAQAIEKIFAEAGFPEGVFQNLLIGSSRIEGVLRDPRIMAATLTGSEKAGQSVATIAASEIKKVVLELGGSDPFIILGDANFKEACAVAVTARLQNNGQSCIAAKRFIVVESIATQFIALFREKFELMNMGDPRLETTQIGPMVSAEAVNEIHAQVQTSVKKGATVVTGGYRPEGQGYFYMPTILSTITPGMPAYNEELFGPVASVITVKTPEEAVAVANDTRFGLGASIWTQNIPLAKKLARSLDAGGIFINGIVKSDPRLPFGGVKKSGYGRELSHYGMKEFVNIKSVWIQ